MPNMVQKTLSLLIAFIFLSEFNSGYLNLGKPIDHYGIGKSAHKPPQRIRNRQSSQSQYFSIEQTNYIFLPFISKPPAYKPDWSNVPWGPFLLVDPTGLQNPVLTAKDVDDRVASYVADPFLFREHGFWYMFMEVLNYRGLGDIGVASSLDGLHWTYEMIVLDEPFHLSYPYVFKYGNTYYMIPETNQLGEVRIYKSDNFPLEWSYLATIIHGRLFVDASIFYYADRWWLFVSDTENKNLYLYSSDSLTENWIEHPKSPVIEGDTRRARPGGRSFIYNGDKIIRIAQSWGDGAKVRAYQVDQLDPSQYAEHEIPESPILEAGLAPMAWYAEGMHHFDPWWTGEYWIAAFDGRGLDKNYSIGIKIATHP
jgi:hypothetical protein